jgi:hypothetical protein
MKDKLGQDAGYSRILQAALLIWVAFTCRADVFLTAENLNSSLKQMQRMQLQLQDEAVADKSNSLYQLGVTADELAKLLTDEVTAHGAENEKLIELALQRTEAMSVAISWHGRHESFFYDGDAFQRYQSEFPEGDDIADVQFRLMKREFYLASATGGESLLESSRNKKAFLDRFPGYENNEQVELFLAIDYRDLYRLYAESGDSTSSREMQEKTVQQFQHIIKEYPDVEAGQIASRLLERFQSEVSQQTRTPGLPGE